MAYTFASPHNSMPGGEAQIHFVQDIEWHAMRHWTDALTNIGLAGPPRYTNLAPSSAHRWKVPSNFAKCVMLRKIANVRRRQMKHLSCYSLARR